MNHITKSTQWEDPRITVSQLPLHQNNQHVAQISGGPGGSLPHGWEQGTTPEGEIYYIDHSTHRTQWHDPRIPQSQQPNIPQRINNQGTSQQRLLQLQREKKAVLVRFLSLYIGKVVYFSNRNSSRISQPSVFVGKKCWCLSTEIIIRISWDQIFISLPKHNFRIVKCWNICAKLSSNSQVSTKGKGNVSATLQHFVTYLVICKWILNLRAYLYMPNISCNSPCLWIIS